MVNLERTNLLEKIRFFEFEHHSLLEKNNVLTQHIKKLISLLHLWMRSFTLELKCLIKKILDKCKTHGEKKKAWGTLIKMKFPLMEKLGLSKVKMKPLTK